VQPSVQKLRPSVGAQHPGDRDTQNIPHNRSKRRDDDQQRDAVPSQAKIETDADRQSEQNHHGTHTATCLGDAEGLVHKMKDIAFPVYLYAKTSQYRCGHNANELL
jgi:hypothetical protein